MQDALFKYCEENLGFKNRVGNALYGNTEGYNSSVFAGKDYFNINISYFLPDTEDETLHELEDKLKFDPLLLSLGAVGKASFTGIRIRFPLNEQSVTETKTVLNSYVEYLRAFNFPELERASRPNEKAQDAFISATALSQQPFFSYTPSSQPYSATPSTPVIIDIKKNKQATPSENIGSHYIIKGILGAFWGATIFALPYFLIVWLVFGSGTPRGSGRIVVLVSVFISWGTALGYTAANGDDRPHVKNAIIISAVAIVSIISTVLGVTLGYPSAQSFSEQLNLALSDSFTGIFIIISLLLNIVNTIIFLKKNKNFLNPTKRR